MRALAVTALAVAALLGCSGCFNEDIASGQLRCSAAGQCPHGYQCGSDGYCWQGHAPGPDGIDLGVADAAVGDDLASAPAAIGASCMADGDCASGHCADGVCCLTACDGLCVSCNGPTVGQCVPVAAGGPSPSGHPTCPSDAASSCGHDGTCDGAGACRLYAATTECAPASCTAPNVFTDASYCDGKGACKTPPTGSCGPFQCANATTCKQSCSGDGDCVAPNTCTNGSCGPKALGQPCTGDSQCGSGNCVDGLCCNVSKASCGGCMACNVTSAPGTCTPVLQGQDPHSTCAANSASCVAGGCNGHGACTPSPATTICSAACSNTSGGVTSFACTGTTTGCPTSGSTFTSCNGYDCADATTCKKSCSAAGDCGTNFQCTSGSCTRVPESNCFDGIDNNGDGLVDCADPTCMPVATCEPSAAGGKLGYMESAACGSGYTNEHLNQNLPDVQSCSGCACNFTLDCVYGMNLCADDKCNTSCDTLTLSWHITKVPGTRAQPANDCLAVPNHTKTYHGLAYEVIPGSGGNLGGGITCNAAGGTPDATAWQTSSYLCSPQTTSAGGCATNQVCAPKPPSGAKVCLKLPSSTTTCPSGMSGSTWYDDGSNISDGRSCSCSCSVSGTSCASTTSSYHSDVFYISGPDYQTCGTPGVGAEGNYAPTGDGQAGGCIAYDSVHGASTFDVGQISVFAMGDPGGTCSTSGSVSGHVTPNSAYAVTVCCEP